MLKKIISTQCSNAEGSWAAWSCSYDKVSDDDGSDAKVSDHSTSPSASSDQWSIVFLEKVHLNLMNEAKKFNTKQIDEDALYCYKLRLLEHKLNADPKKASGTNQTLINLYRTEIQYTTANRSAKELIKDLVTVIDNIYRDLKEKKQYSKELKTLQVQYKCRLEIARGPMTPKEATALRNKQTKSLQGPQNTAAPETDIPQEDTSFGINHVIYTYTEKNKRNPKNRDYYKNLKTAIDNYVKQKDIELNDKPGQSLQLHSEKRQCIKHIVANDPNAKYFKDILQ